MSIDVDWEIQQQLRQNFLSVEGNQTLDYWTEQTLAQYDLTFAQRIGWKWDSVFSEISESLGPLLEDQENKTRELVDLGCGTGIASRKLMEHIPNAAETFRRLRLVDRSERSLRFARDQIQHDAEKALPDIETQTAQIPCEIKRDAVVLLSHVIGELTEVACKRLVHSVSKSSAVLWVEPGTKAISHRLAAAHDILRERFLMVAPCPHQLSCPITKNLATDNSKDWCHHFAPPPSDVFQSRFWSQFSRKLGIDLRSLPLSYLVMVNKRSKWAEQVQLPKTEGRLIGRPRFDKVFATAACCRHNGQWSEARIQKRPNKVLFRRLKQGPTFGIEIANEHFAHVPREND